MSSIQLRERSFEALLRRLDQDRDRAGERYEMLRRKLVSFFSWRGSARADELADLVLDRLAEKIAGGEEIRAGDPGVFALGIARNVRLEAIKREARGPVLLEHQDLGQTPAALEDEHAEARDRCLETCLSALAAPERTLMLAYFRETKGAKILERQTLAQMHGLSPNALRIRVHRLRGRLEACVRRCLETAKEGEIQ